MVYNGREALSGLLNIGAQLSQEGSEGDINLLSAGLGALTGLTLHQQSFTGQTSLIFLVTQSSGDAILKKINYATQKGLDFTNFQIFRPGGESKES